MTNPETIEVTAEIEKVVLQAVSVALEFEDLVGRKLGISGSVGEVVVAKEFGLRLVKSDIEEGYDAIDGAGRKVEIKVRRSEGGRGREIPTDRSVTSRFSEHPYHYALLAILTRDYRLHEVHKAALGQIEAAFKGKRKRVLSIGKFKRIGKRVFPS